MKKSHLSYIILSLCLVLVVGTISGCGKLAQTSIGQFVATNQLAVAVGAAVVGGLVLASGSGSPDATTTTTTTTSTSTSTSTTTSTTTTTQLTFYVIGTVESDAAYAALESWAIVSTLEEEHVASGVVTDETGGSYPFAFNIAVPQTLLDTYSTDSLRFTVGAPPNQSPPSFSYPADCEIVITFEAGQLIYDMGSFTLEAFE